MKVDYVEYAKDMVLKILNNGKPTPEAIYEIIEIKSGNKKTLLEHFIAIRNNMNNAIEEKIPRFREEIYIDDYNFLHQAILIDLDEEKRTNGISTLFCREKVNPNLHLEEEIILTETYEIIERIHIGDSNE